VFKRKLETRGQRGFVGLPDAEVDLYANFPQEIRKDRGLRSRGRFVATLSLPPGSRTPEAVGRRFEALAGSNSATDKWRQRQRQAKQITSKLIVLVDHGHLLNERQDRANEDLLVVRWMPRWLTSETLSDALGYLNELDRVLFEPSPLLVGWERGGAWDKPFHRLRFALPDADEAAEARFKALGAVIGRDGDGALQWSAFGFTDRAEDLEQALQSRGLEGSLRRVDKVQAPVQR